MQRTLCSLQKPPLFLTVEITILPWKAPKAKVSSGNSFGRFLTLCPKSCFSVDSGLHNLMEWLRLSFEVS